MRQFLTKLTIIGILIVAGLTLAPATPQPANAQYAWGVTLWVADSSGSYLETANPLGSLVKLPLSPNLTPPIEFNSYLVMTSDDDRYILHLGLDPNTSEPHLMFGATVDGSCCMDVSDMIPNAMAYELAGFEPNGSQFAFSYVRAVEGTGAPFAGGIMVIDAATGDILQNMPMETAMTEIGQPQTAAWALMGDWTEQGIEFTGNCYACEGVFEGQFALWNPDTGTFSTNPGINFSSFGARLDLTGEIILQKQDTHYAYDPSPGMFAIPNVVNYYANGDTSGTGTVVYVDSETLAVGRLHWVGDGQAFLVEPTQGDYWDVVYRDGNVRRVLLLAENEAEFLGGTPEGWLAILANSDGTRTLYHYDLATLAQSAVTDFATDVISVQLANSPRLGASIETLTFAPTTPPTNGVATARCPNFLPSRLVVGQAARVTPGTANRMREHPDLNSTVVGQIPGEAQFSVLEGPFCDEANGIAWWRVNYNGAEGWTAEGQGETYWTEPLE